LFPLAPTTALPPPFPTRRSSDLASPSPVPPYLRVVEGSACTNSWNKRPTCSGDIPMPVSAPVIVISARPRSVTRRDHDDRRRYRSEEHTSELQSPYDLVCRLLLE